MNREIWFLPFIVLVACTHEGADLSLDVAEEDAARAREERALRMNLRVREINGGTTTTVDHAPSQILDYLTRECDASLLTGLPYTSPTNCNYTTTALASWVTDQATNCEQAICDMAMAQCIANRAAEISTAVTTVTLNTFNNSGVGIVVEIPPQDTESNAKMAQEALKFAQHALVVAGENLRRATGRNHAGGRCDPPPSNDLNVVIASNGQTYGAALATTLVDSYYLVQSLGEIAASETLAAADADLSRQASLGTAARIVWNGDELTRQAVANMLIGGVTSASAPVQCANDEPSPEAEQVIQIIRAAGPPMATVGNIAPAGGAETTVDELILGDGTDVGLRARLGQRYDRTDLPTNPDEFLSRMGLTRDGVTEARSYLAAESAAFNRQPTKATKVRLVDLTNSVPPPAPRYMDNLYAATTTSPRNPPGLALVAQARAGTEVSNDRALWTCGTCTPTYSYYTGELEFPSPPAYAKRSVAHSLEYAASVAFDAVSRPALLSLMDPTPRNVLAGFIGTAHPEGGRTESCYRRVSGIHKAQIRVYNESVPGDFIVVRELAGLTCATRGDVENTPCTLAEHLVNATATTGTPSSEYGYRTYVQLNFDVTAVGTPRFYVLKRRAGTRANVGAYEQVGTMTITTFAGSDTMPAASWEWCNLAPVNVELYDEAADALKRSTHQCLLPLRACAGASNQRIPLEDDLVGTTPDAERSWRRYLDSAHAASELSDHLAEQVIQSGLELDQRAEGAIEEIETLCGGPINLDGLLPTDLASVHSTTSCTTEGALCADTTQRCRSGFCVRDATAVLESRRAAGDETARRLLDCVGEGSNLDYVALGSQPMCVWEDAGAPDVLCRGATAAFPCPFPADSTTCTATGHLPPGLTGVTVPIVPSEVLNLFEETPGAELPGTPPPCDALRAARLGSEPALDAVVESGFFRLENVRAWAERLGWQGRPDDYSAVTLDGNPWRSMGDSLGSPVTGWPCGAPLPGADGSTAFLSANCLLGTPTWSRDGIACSYVASGGCTGDANRVTRARLNHRLARGVLAILLTSDVSPDYRFNDPFRRAAMTDYRFVDGFDAVTFSPAGMMTRPGRRSSRVQYLFGIGPFEDRYGVGYCTIATGAEARLWTDIIGPLTATPIAVQANCNRGITGEPPLLFRSTDLYGRGRNADRWSTIMWGGMAGPRDEGRDVVPPDWNNLYRKLLEGEVRADEIVISPAQGTNFRLTNYFSASNVNTLRIARDGLRGSDLLDGMELLCEAARNDTVSCEELGPTPRVDDLRDLGRLRAYLNCAAARIEDSVNRQVMRDVPRAILDTNTNVRGERGAAIHELRAAAAELRIYAVDLAALLRAAASDMRRLELALARNDVRQDLADLEMWATIASQAAACGVAVAAAFTPAGSVLSAATTCATAAVNAGFAVARHDLVSDSIELEGEMTLEDFRRTIDEHFTQLSTMQVRLDQAAESLKASTERLETQRTRGLRLIGKALMLDSGPLDTHFAVNTVLRRRYNTNLHRYREARERAINMAFLAKLAIEQRLGVRMADLNEDMTLVEAPARWHEEICTATGVDYARIRDGTRLGEDDAGDNYADLFIGDYVRKLEDVVESYRLDFPFGSSEDVAVISMRDEIMNVLARCDVPAHNLLARSNELMVRSTVSDADPVEGEEPPPPVVEDGWRIVPTCVPVTGDAADSCVSISPISTTSTADRPAPPYIPELGPTKGYRITFAPRRLLSGDTTSATAATRVAQDITLVPGRYRLSWYVRNATETTHPASAMVVTKVSDGSTIMLDAVQTIPETITAGREEWKRHHAAFVVTEETLVRIAIQPRATNPTFEHYLEIGGIQVESVPTVEAMGTAIPREFIASSTAGHAPLSLCEDTSGTVFRDQWVRGCTNLCPGGIDRYCPPDGPCEPCPGGVQRCYREFAFPISLQAIESGALIHRAGFAYGNFNHRIDSIAVNFVGSQVRGCEDELLPSTCYSGAFVPYSIEHRQPFAVRDYLGNDTYEAPLFDGFIEYGRGLAAERYITNPISTADRALLEDYDHIELRGRPLTGQYKIRIWEDPTINWRGIEDVQIVLRYRYWTRFERGE